ncbi:sigma-54-dependent Fis family transcriptional regulator [Mycolicibacterium palauense]|uniref:sigma-54-dependent Fis family transcriptional regulator n=1 Tax=Mycolicibacterium palauense TaxID=2034511 RepID=UPI000BFEFC2B|nr:helix-turn-helix domain-containing protein [Mycolicibacterium palauense]
MSDSAFGSQSLVSPRSARRALIEGAELPSTVPALIRRSWLRSIQAGAGMERITVPFDAVSGSGSRLLANAAPVLSRFAEGLIDTRVNVLLAERNGRILARWAGSSAALRWLDRASIDTGFVFSEEFAGTNGIGTAIEELKPVHIRAGEHFAESLIEHVCVGVPIHNRRSRRLEGVVALSCPSADANNLLAPTALNLAHQIESEITNHLSEADQIVFDEFLASSRTSSAPILALSEQYMVTNAAAAELVDISDQASLWNQALESLRTRRDSLATLMLSSGRSIDVACSRISVGSRTVGALITIVPHEPATTARNTPNVAVSSRLSTAQTLLAEVDGALADSVRAVSITGLPGTGKLFLARQVHQRRYGDSPQLVYSAGSAATEGDASWLRRLGELVAEPHASIVVTSVDLLAAQTVRAAVELLKSAPSPRLVVLTHGPAADPELLAELSRVSQAWIRVPELRLRRDEIQAIAQGILTEQDRPARITQRATAALMAYSWPGNIRELRTEILAASHRSSGEITTDSLSEHIRSAAHGWRSLTRLETVERDAILEVLEANNGNKIKAAAALGVSRSTLYRRLREFGIEPRRTVI